MDSRPFMRQLDGQMSEMGLRTFVSTAFGRRWHRRPVESARPRLLDQVREAIRTRHYSRRTEQAYAYWIRRFIAFHHMAHPSTMGAREVSAFLAWLATRQQVSASTQNQALSAVLFLYRVVLRQDIGAIDSVPRVLAAVVNTTVVASENLTVGSTVWLPAESMAPGR
jgi:hypothetical protein